jgi:hypothetical protein
MPLQHLTTEILLTIVLSFSIVLILFVMVSAAVASILSEERTKVEPSLERKPKDQTEL